MGNYFFGSYFKLQSNNQTMALIPSYAKHKGNYISSIQIITDNKSYVVEFPYSSYKKGKDFEVSIDENVFTQKGIKLNIDNSFIKLKGEIIFNDINKLEKDIMGPFRFVPFMECVHSVHSIKHPINGKLYLNDEEYDFNDSFCYIEGDKGRSFPKVYIWTQAILNKGSLMLSVADIPFGLFHFTGIIGFINYNNSTKIIATYKGAKILKVKNNEVIVKQGSYKFGAKLIEKKEFPLLSPTIGKMDRIIKESASCIARYKLTNGDKTFFDIQTKKASFEYEYTPEREINKIK